MMKHMIVAAGAAMLMVPGMATAKNAPATTDTTAAPSAEAIAAAERLLDAMHIERVYDSTFSLMLPQLTKIVFEGLRDSDKSTPALKAYLLDSDNLGRAERLFAENAMTMFRQHYPDLKKATAKEYAATFTADELNQLTAFYGTPVGQKALKTMPELQRKVAPYGAEAGRKVGVEAMIKTLEAIGFGSQKTGA